MTPGHTATKSDGAQGCTRQGPNGESVDCVGPCGCSSPRLDDTLEKIDLMFDLKKAYDSNAFAHGRLLRAYLPLRGKWLLRACDL